MDKPKAIPRSRPTPSASTSRLQIQRDSISTEPEEEPEPPIAVEKDTENNFLPHKGRRGGKGRNNNQNKTPITTITPVVQRRDRPRPSRGGEGGGGGRQKDPTISVEDDDDLNTSDLRRQIDRLERDLERRDRELDEERGDNERHMDSIKKLERDKVELKRELEGLRDEAEDYKRSLDDYKERSRRAKRSGGVHHIEGDSDELDGDEHTHGTVRGLGVGTATGFELAIQQKNKELEQLLDDIEKIEDEKHLLQDNLTMIKDSLGEATKQIESMAKDHFSMKSRLQQSEERIKQLEEDKTILSIRERELLGFKERQDQYLDNLCNAVDIRVDVWKKMMYDKDEEIDRLNSKISTLMNQLPNTQMDSERSNTSALNKKLKEREHQIALLNEQLTQATIELDSNTSIIQELQSKLTLNGNGGDGRKTSNLVKSLQSTVKKQQDKLARKSEEISSLEYEAEEKSKNLTNLLSRLSDYESGIYGLPEAVTEIKDLKLQIRIRDKQVEGVTQEINVLQMQVSEIQEENEMLRDKLGVDGSLDISRETRRYVRNRKNELSALRSKVVGMQDEIVNLKTDNHTLKKHIQIYDQQFQQSNVSGNIIGGGMMMSAGSLPPGAERDRPDGGSVSSPKQGSHSHHHQTQDVMQGDVYLKGLNATTYNKADNQWKEKYELSLEENTALRRGLQEILECMHKMTEHDVELKESLTSTLKVNSHLEQLRIQVPTSRPPTPSLSAISIPLLKISSTRFDTPQPIPTEDKEIQTEMESTTTHEPPVVVPCRPSVTQDDKEVQFNIEVIHREAQAVVKVINQENQTDLKPTSGKQIQTEAEDEDEINVELLKALENEKELLEEEVQQYKTQIEELQGILRSKDDALADLQMARSQYERDYQRLQADAEDDMKDALVVARETISSLQDRLKAKEENVNQYRRLLADVRNEMTSATERHVQEMKALQMTIHQQQQAFTRLKSTLSHPVKDNNMGVSVEGTIKDQLNRIYELEDEVSQLQHAMSNTASQLTAARSEAHRWRCEAESRSKEMDSVSQQHHQQINRHPIPNNIVESYADDVGALRAELRDCQRKLEETQHQLDSYKSSSARESMTDLVNVLRNELNEKDKQIDAYSKSLHNLRNSNMQSDRHALEERLQFKESEINSLKEEIKQHQKTISGLQVKISKTKAVNYKSGMTQELEELRNKNKDLSEEKIKLDKSISELNQKRDEEEHKKIKSAESVARWEEGKKWKKSHEKQEARLRELESENERFKRTMQNLRITITRLEKEKISLETKLNSRHNQQRSNSLSTGERFSSADSASSQSQTNGNSSSDALHQQSLMSQGEIAKLKMEIQDLQELNEKIEFEGREEAEKLKMEVKLLKDRIVTQERQLTAYQIAQKGDVKTISEIENMVSRETQFQKEIRRLEEDNLHLNLQIEQLRLDTPRLRDRVQHLQRLVEALKSENPPTSSMGGNASQSSSSGTNKSNNQRSLGELEKTINALKLVIEKLQNENKRLKIRPASNMSTSTEKLKTSMDNIMEEKKSLLDKVQTLELENEKLSRKYSDSVGRVESTEIRLLDAEQRAKSAEMKLRTFLEANRTQQAEQPHSGSYSTTSYDALVHKMRTMQEELETKSKLLAAAKQSLRAAEKATAPKPMTSPRANNSNETNNVNTVAGTSASSRPGGGTGSGTVDELDFYSIV